MFKTPHKHINGSSTTASTSTSNGTTNANSQSLDSRKRQSKKDDAIRRKIENDLSKKKKTGTKSSKQKHITPGTVSSLRPSDPIICKTSSTVYEVSQLMSAKRENCVLVVNDNGELLGIFTAKDLAFRVVGSNLNAATVTIDKIMSPNPLCANSTAPASEALTLMVERGFRHLPVLDENNHIVGVLDITKCYAQQMEKLERMHASSKKLYDALDSVHSEMGSLSEQPLQVFQYFEDLRNKMNGPTLESVLDSATIPVYADVKTSVFDATVLMKQNRTTAVLVKDNNDDVTGIFTSKDVVLRVIAAGLNPKKCSLVRVMTPQPDVANVTLPIQQALRQMFDGHYLNLPVIGDQHEIIGIVEVLKLTYATLNQIKEIESSSSEHGNGSTISLNSKQPSQSQQGQPPANHEGPAWNKFWSGLDNEDSESVASDSVTGSVPDVTASEFHSFNVDIKPSDSISHTGSPSKSSQKVSTNNSSLLREQIDLPFTFKFKSPAIEGRVHRISLKPSEGIKKLRILINEKLSEKDFQVLKIKNSLEDGESYAISYIDDEGDIVSITSDNDLVECITINQKLDNDKADLFLHNPHESAVNSSTRPSRKSSNNKKHSSSSSTIISGVPNEILIPGALAFLASSIVVGVSLSRR
ncbi:CBS domain-containing protein [Scheffersomyces coipomensis]|uniref:CBS domain-containing protein n=1 Tax=Scheffersomyces coipomensis TaxID=1788519 RepID=UPI00315DC38F